MMAAFFHEDEPIDLVLVALANPLRRALIDRLTERDINVSDLADGAGVSMPSISRHLRVLEKANLIVRMKQGRNHLISLQRDPLLIALRWLENVSGHQTASHKRPTVPDFADIPSDHSDPQPEAEPVDSVEQSDPLDLSPDSLSDLVKRLKRG
jgi:DNA-binding transcriptional ArsR family regulator